MTQLTAVLIAFELQDFCAAHRAAATNHNGYLCSGCIFEVLSNQDLCDSSPIIVDPDTAILTPNAQIMGPSCACGAPFNWILSSSTRIKKKIETIPDIPVTQIIEGDNSDTKESE